MDASQQTPTQVNEDRDYEAFCDALPSSPADDEPVADATVRTAPERTLQDDDTGAVNFGIPSEAGRPSSQVSEDAGFENTRGDWRNQDHTSQQFSSRGYTPHKPNGLAPQTPALPKNPFGSKANVAAPLAGTQLFGQTQLSSAVKKISPTSSRPSPNLFHDSISPNILETSPLKNRTNVSSPTDLGTSSPQGFHDVPGTIMRARESALERIAEESPSNVASAKEELVPESPTVSPRPRSSGWQPLAHYEPLERSQQRKLNGDGLQSHNTSDDSDPDDVIRRMDRRKRVERKKAQAAEEMDKVRFTRLARQSSPDEPRRKRRRVMSDDEEMVTAEALETSYPTKSSEVTAVVRDSQKLTAGVKHKTCENATELSLAVNAEETEAQDEMEPQQLSTTRIADEDMIPATSPAQSPPATDRRMMVPASEPDLPSLTEIKSSSRRNSEASAEVSSLPPSRRQTRRTYGRIRARRDPFMTSSASEQITSDTPADPTTTSLPNLSTSEPSSRITRRSRKDASRKLIEESFARNETSETSPRAVGDGAAAAVVNTRSLRSNRNPLTPLQPRASEPRITTSSSLTTMSTTPVQSSKTTPATLELPSSEQRRPGAQPSTDDSDIARKRWLHGKASSESPRPLTRVLRAARSLPRIDSGCLDELEGSPSASALEHSMAPARASRTSRHSLVPNQRAVHLFWGMVFAISFQSSQAKQQERTTLESKILQAGGVILQDGFQELFEHNSIVNATQPVYDQSNTMKLTKTGAESWFTALIADAHSRKAKYMQALALGLPCLAPQWITACLNKGGIVPWEPYLLCAGSSAVLGNAIRSRSLLPYSAAGARLADIIKQRPKLLYGCSLLVVVDARKSRSEAKQPYVFLAQALGPSVSRVFTTQQARDALRERDEAGSPFHWVYVDKRTGMVDDIFAVPETSSKKRKKSAAAAAAPLSPSTRVMYDELVVQSLILGRMVEEEEVCF